MTTDGPTADEDDPGTPDRMITLTDGVVAIAMTLLALDLRPDVTEVGDASSSRDLARYFGDHAGQYGAFVLAFAIVAQYWSAHHRLMRGIGRHDAAMVWPNMLFLFGVTLVPLTTYLTGNFSAPLATTIFAGSMVLMSISLALMSEIADHRGLRAHRRDPAERLRVRGREAVTIAVPLAVAVLTWFMPGSAYLFLLFFVADLPGRWLAGRRAARAAVSRPG